MCMEFKRVLCIGGHSLDAEVMGGPLIIKLAKKGIRCTMAHVTQGRIEKEDATEKEKQDYLDKIKIENEMAANIMGADVKRFYLDSSHMPSEESFTQDLIKYFKEEKFDLVITHFSGTFHPRHLYTHNCVINAVKALINQGEKITVLYGENCEDLVGFIPQMYIQLEDDEVNQWFEGLKKYDIFNGLVNAIPYYPYYHSMGIIRGMEAGNDKFTKAYMYATLIENEF